jgi:hypothetical protein
MYAISTDVDKLWKAKITLVLHTFKVLPALERKFCAPVVPRGPL